MKPKFAYYKRVFLNRPGEETVGAVLVSVKRAQWGVDVQCVISDCNRVVSLSLDDNANSIQKLNKLINALTGLLNELMKK